MDHCSRVPHRYSVLWVGKERGFSISAVGAVSVQRLGYRVCVLSFYHIITVGFLCRGNIYTYKLILDCLSCNDLIKHVWVLQIVLRSADVLKQIETAFTLAGLETLIVSGWVFLMQTHLVSIIHAV